MIRYYDDVTKKGYKLNYISTTNQTLFCKTNNAIQRYATENVTGIWCMYRINIIISSDTYSTANDKN